MVRKNWKKPKTYVHSGINDKEISDLDQSNKSFIHSNQRTIIEFLQKKFKILFFQIFFAIIDIVNTHKNEFKISSK